MRLIIAVVMALVLTGCSREAQVPKTYSDPTMESRGDNLKREHIYKHIQKVDINTWMKYRNPEQQREQIDAYLIKLDKECRNKYRNMPIQDLYDIARFEYGYVEPR